MENNVNQNYDEIFNDLSREEKVNLLSNVSSKINKRFQSLYSDSILYRIWNCLTYESKKAGVEMYNIELKKRG